MRSTMVTAQPARPPRCGRPPRVLLAGPLTALAAPGGGETQLQATCRALAAGGVAARLWRPWEDSLDQCDLVHLFGSVPEHLAVAAAARRRGKPVVVSPVAWFDPASRWQEGGHLLRRACGAGSLLFRRCVPRWPDWRSRLYRQAAALLPNSQAEAAQLRDYFAIPAGRLFVVPNAAAPLAPPPDADCFARRVGGPGYVLCPGRIEPRKNQLGLIRAVRGTGLRTVILGDAVPGHERYLAACKAAADASVRFVPRVPPDDPLLAAAYAGCGCLALVSWFETPGLVALEAAQFGVPLVLTERGCAREYFGPLADYVSPADGRAIRAAVLAACRGPRSAGRAELVRRHFTWDHAAAATRAAYEAVLSPRSTGKDPA